MNRTELGARFCEVRSFTERLAAPLSPEDQTVQSMPDTSPTKWHRAHVTWFFETFVLADHEPNFAPFDERYRYLFNSYYEAAGPRFARAQRGLITRPGAAEVGVFRADVDRRIRELVETIDDESLRIIIPLVVLGMHHEQQHQELMLMDIKHALSINPLQPAFTRASTTPSAFDGDGQDSSPGELGWIDFEGGLVEVGVDPTGPFYFDNEGPRHKVWLEPFRLADRLVTCGEWLDFMADGGYTSHEHWLSEGWYTVQRDGWEAPLYWSRDGDRWLVHTLEGTREVERDEPACHVSHFEADAFATWAGRRLPTEFEWEHAAVGRPLAGQFADSARLHPLPAGAADGSLRQLHGTCWEWTASAYRPYPGFRPAPGALGEYNGKWMSNQMVLRGGCVFTPPGHHRATYRNFFAPHSRWMLSGVRLADGSDPE